MTAKPIPLPAGSVPLTVDDACWDITHGNHVDAGEGNLILDAALIAGLRGGMIRAYRLPDGRFGFGKAQE